MALSDQPVLLFLDQAGDVVHATDSVHEAVRLARENEAEWLAPHPMERIERVAANPPAPGLSLAASRIPVVKGLWQRYTLKEAWKEVAYLFKEVIAVTGSGIKNSAEIVSQKGLLTDNAKLHKRDANRPAAVALGLSLVPEASVFKGESEGGVGMAPPLSTLQEDAEALLEAGGGSEAPRSLQRRLLTRERATFCNQASPECMKVCLVLSGQNQSTTQSNFAKFAKAKALALHPAAFVAILAENLRRYAGSDSYQFGGRSWQPWRGGVVPGDMRPFRFVRLNVFQDIPWELVAPDMLELAQDLGIGLYDYTKIPGRCLDFPGYDLTFSFSGTNGHLCDSELRRGRRLAVAFAVEKQGRQRGIATKPYFLPAGKMLRDPMLLDGAPIPVVDGDVSDVRPLDAPGPVIVALKFKPPRPPHKASRAKGYQPFHPKHFVVLGRHVVLETYRRPRPALRLDEKRRLEGIVARGDEGWQVALKALKAEAKQSGRPHGRSVDTIREGFYVIPESPLSTAQNRG